MVQSISVAVLFATALLVHSQSSRQKIQYENVAEFLFKNAKTCGDPFSDPVWVPTLDLCNIPCHPTKEYCVENEELKQMCKELPDECQKLLRKALRQSKLPSRRLLRRSNTNV